MIFAVGQEENVERERERERECVSHFMRGKVVVVVWWSW
jgi:hypothetical protein